MVEMPWMECRLVEGHNQLDQAHHDINRTY